MTIEELKLHTATFLKTLDNQKNIEWGYGTEKENADIEISAFIEWLEENIK